MWITQSTSTTANTNPTWVLIWADVHPSLGQRKIDHFSDCTKSLPGPPEPLQDAEAYTGQLVTNTQRNLQHLRRATQHLDIDMTLATWNVQGDQIYNTG